MDVVNIIDAVELLQRSDDAVEFELVGNGSHQ